MRAVLQELPLPISNEAVTALVHGRVSPWVPHQDGWREGRLFAVAVPGPPGAIRFVHIDPMRNLAAGAVDQEQTVGSFFKKSHSQPPGRSMVAASTQPECGPGTPHHAD